MCVLFGLIFVHWSVLVPLWLLPKAHFPWALKVWFTVRSTSCFLFERDWTKRSNWMEPENGNYRDRTLSNKQSTGSCILTYPGIVIDWIFGSSEFLAEGILLSASVEPQRGVIRRWSVTTQHVMWGMLVITMMWISHDVDDDGVSLTGWPRPDFSWTEYLNHCRAVAAPESCFQLVCRASVSVCVCVRMCMRACD